MSLDINVQQESFIQYIYDVIEECKLIFNEEIGEELFRENNLKVVFFTPDNGIEVYEKFCEEYFPNWKGEIYKEPGYMESFTAQAFVNKNIYGIMVCVDMTIHPNQWYPIILHEMSHIFCNVKEFNGNSFYCDYYANLEENTFEKSFIGVGYAIWREFIAEYFAATTFKYEDYSIPELRDRVRSYDEKIGAKESKLWLSYMFALIFSQSKIRNAGSAEAVVDYLIKHNIFAKSTIAESYKGIIARLLNQISKDEYWKFSCDFIFSLAEDYMSFIATRDPKYIYEISKISEILNFTEK